MKKRIIESRHFMRRNRRLNEAVDEDLVRQVEAVIEELNLAYYGKDEDDEIDDEDEDIDFDAEEDDEEGMSLIDILNNSLDIEYTKSINGTYLGARIATTLGGPNVFINTRNGKVEGYWGGSSYDAYIDDEIVNALDELIEEMIEN